MTSIKGFFVPQARSASVSGSHAFHDTPNDAMNGIDADLFKIGVADRVEALRDGQPDIIAVAGRTSRRRHARDRGREPLHRVSAWATRRRPVLGREDTDVTSDEITAIPLPLERLDLTGALVTTDAMGTRTAIADTPSAVRCRGCGRTGVVLVSPRFPIRR